MANDLVSKPSVWCIWSIHLAITTTRSVTRRWIARFMNNGWCRLSREVREKLTHPLVVWSHSHVNLIGFLFLVRSKGFMLRKEFSFKTSTMVFHGLRSLRWKGIFRVVSCLSIHFSPLSPTVTLLLETLTHTLTHIDITREPSILFIPLADGEGNFQRNERNPYSLYWAWKEVWGCGRAGASGSWRLPSKKASNKSRQWE